MGGGENNGGQWKGLGTRLSVGGTKHDTMHTHRHTHLSNAMLLVLMVVLTTGEDSLEATPTSVAANFSTSFICLSLTGGSVCVWEGGDEYYIQATYMHHTQTVMGQREAHRYHTCKSDALSPSQKLTAAQSLLPKPSSSHDQSP